MLIVQLLKITRASESDWTTSNILPVSFASLVVPEKLDEYIQMRESIRHTLSLPPRDQRFAHVICFQRQLKRFRCRSRVVCKCDEYYAATHCFVILTSALKWKVPSQNRKLFEIVVKSHNLIADLTIWLFLCQQSILVKHWFTWLFSNLFTMF